MKKPLVSPVTDNNDQKLQELISKKEAGEFAVYTKKEQVLIDRDIARINAKIILSIKSEGLHSFGIWAVSARLRSYAQNCGTGIVQHGRIGHHKRIVFAQARIGKKLHIGQTGYLRRATL